MCVCVCVCVCVCACVYVCVNVCQSGFKLNASLYVFVFPLLSLSLAQRRVWLGEATKSGAAMAAPAAPAPTALVL